MTDFSSTVGGFLTDIKSNIPGQNYQKHFRQMSKSGLRRLNSSYFVLWFSLHFKQTVDATAFSTGS